MRQIINSLLDTDLYTFSLCYLYLQKFPRAMGRYSFVDRNETCYPEGFAEKVAEQLQLMENINVEDSEVRFMSERCYYFPKWFFVFLKGYRFNSSEVRVGQDQKGHLSIEIEGTLWKTVFWEQPILAVVSELFHELNGDHENYDAVREYDKSYDKCRRMSQAGVSFSEFGTRRRFSFEHQDLVVRSLSDYVRNNPLTPGACVGTSNVYFAKKYNMVPIGTMSHQLVSAIGSFYGPSEANNIAMNTWEEVYNGSLGTYLYDTFTRKVFLDNFSKKNAKLFDGLRVDSGDNYEAFEEIASKYDSFKIDPRTKTICFSNALNCDQAIEIHNYVAGRMLDCYGIGTNLTCDVDNVNPSNIVIKLTGAKITESRVWNNCVKLSDDLGKYTGKSETINIYKKILGIS